MKIGSKEKVVKYMLILAPCVGAITDKEKIENCKKFGKYVIPLLSILFMFGYFLIGFIHSKT